MFRKKRVLFGRAEKGGRRRTAGRERGGFLGEKDRENRDGGRVWGRGGRWGRGRAAGQTVRRTGSASGARRSRRSRGGLRPGLAACRGRRGRLPQGMGEAHGRPGKGKAGGERAARRALRRSRSRRPEAAETAAGGLPCGPCPRMAQRSGMGFCGGNGRIGKLKECLLPFTAKMCYNISLGNFPKNNPAARGEQGA